jgi:hypothetical protein
MSVRTRAQIIAMAGPAIQGVGLAWEAVHLLTGHNTFDLTPRHLTAVLVIVVGFLVSLVCIPAAIEVSHATPEELELQRLGAVEPEEGRHRRRTADG